MPNSLTDDQITALRLVRGDRLPPYPFRRPQTRIQDRSLLLALALIAPVGRGRFELTERGVRYLASVDEAAFAESLGSQTAVQMRSMG